MFRSRDVYMLMYKKIYDKSEEEDDHSKDDNECEDDNEGDDDDECEDGNESVDGNECEVDNDPDHNDRYMWGRAGEKSEDDD
jgi:hypothetical protein